MPTTAEQQTQHETTSITRTICQFAAELSYDDIPSEVREAAKIFTLEAVGHMVAGLKQPVGKIVSGYVRSLGGAPQASVLGAGFKASLAEAAYATGTLAHTDELEAYGPLPGTGLVPPICAGLAVGEYIAGSTGRQYLTALVAGVEVQGRLGSAALGAPDRGFMGISLVGPAGAGVAAGRLLGLSTEQLQHCLGAALPLAGGSLRGCGYMSHVHEAGVPAGVGVSSAVLAAQGFTSCPNFLDGDFSWGEQFASGGRGYHPEKITENLGDPFFLAAPGSAPKRYGACGLTHQTIEGLIGLMTEHGISHTDIDHVEMLVPPFATRVASFTEPTNGEQAKFSMLQGIAGILVEGVPTLPYTTAFTDDASRDPRYVAARRRVLIEVDTSRPNVRGFDAQTVTAVLNSGERVSRRVELSTIRGRATAPLSVSERVEMFRNTVSDRLDATAANRAVDLVMDGEDQPVAALAEALATARPEL